jgi:isoleucyl-tRNA synthetase
MDKPRHAIEVSAIIKEQKLNRKGMECVRVSNECQALAKRLVVRAAGAAYPSGSLGRLGNTTNLTRDAKIEAEEVRVFGQDYEKGNIFHGQKARLLVPSDDRRRWRGGDRIADGTYAVPSMSSPGEDDKGKLGKFCESLEALFRHLDTTTWTIPGTLPRCLNAELDFVLARALRRRDLYLAKGAHWNVQRRPTGEPEVLAEMKGAAFELMTAVHPLIDRESVVLLGEHVTLTARGTGCVHNRGP